jgi:hypothetical protein
MHSPDLPEPIAAYFAADRIDGQAVAHCFNADGVVLDKGHTHRGAAQIAAWKAEASKKYSYTAEPRTLAREGDAYVVTSRVSGDFPGSPVDLRYAFTLARGWIASLEVTP